MFMCLCSGLSLEGNMLKMRLLTFMQMCESKLEIDFATIQYELQLEPQDIEAFIIDGALSQLFFYLLIHECVLPEDGLCRE